MLARFCQPRTIPQRRERIDQKANGKGVDLGDHRPADMVAPDDVIDVVAESEEEPEQHEEQKR
jgi:hypothetical protein